MFRRPRRFRFLLFFALVLAVGLAGSLYVRSSLLLRHLAPFVARSLTRRSGATVLIGNLDGTLFGHITAHHVTLTENESAPPMLWADALDVSFRPTALLRRHLDIERIGVSGLELRVRRAKGEPFDLQKVLDRLLGERVPSAKPSPWTVGVGELDIAVDRLAVDDEESAIHLRIARMRLLSQSPALIPLNRARPLSIRADGGAFVLGDLRQVFSRLELKGHLSSERLVLNEGRLQQGESHASFTGTVAFVPQVRCDLRGEASAQLRDVRGLNPSALKDAEGLVILSDIRLVGDGANPTFRADVLLNGFRHPALRLERVTAQAVGNFHALAIAPIETRFLDGKIRASAVWRFDEKGELLFRADAARLSLRALRRLYLASQPVLELLDGTFSGTLTARWVGAHFHSSGVWTADRITWKGQPVEVGRWRHTIEDDVVRAEGVAAGIAIAARGRLPHEGNPLDFRLVAKGGNIADAASLFGFAMSGALDAEAIVAGTPQNPTVAFNAHLQNGTVHHVYPLRSLDIEGDWNAERVHLHSVRLSSGDGYAHVAGDVRFPPNAPPHLDVHLRAERWDLAPYLRAVAKGIPFAGLLEGELSLRGAPETLDVAGEIRLGDVRLGEVPLFVEPIPVRAREGAFELPRLAVSIGGARASGHLSFNQANYAFEFGLDEPVTVEALRASLPEQMGKPLVDLDGMLEFRAWGDARFNAPSAALTISVDNLSYRNLSLGRSVADVLLDGSEIRGRGTLVDRNFELELRVNLTESSLPMTARLSCSESDILPLLHIVGQPAGKGIKSVLLTGAVDFSGDLTQRESLVGKVLLSKVSLSTGRHTVQNTQPVHGTITASGVELDRLAMASANPDHPLDILAEGLLDWSRPVHLNVDSRVFDLATVAGFLGLPDRFHGTGTYRLRVRGTTQDPDIETTLYMDSAAFEVAPDRPPLVVRDVVGEVSYRDKALHLNRVAFRLGENPIEIAGEIPFDLSFVLIPLVERVVDAPMSVTIRNHDRDLSWLKGLDKNLSELDGETTLDIRLFGTVDKPIVEGTLALRIPRAVIGSSKSPLTEINLHLQLDTSTGSEGARYVRARVEGEGTFETTRARGSGFALLPIPSDYLTKGFRLDELRGELTTRIEEGSFASLVAAMGGKRLPLDVAFSGGAKWMVRGVDPKTLSGTLLFNPVVLTGNGRTMKNRAPVTATFSENVFRIGDFSIEDDAARIDVDGSFRVPDKMFELNVEAKNVDLSLVSGFVAPRSLTGRLDATLSASGTLAAPRFSMEWQAHHATLERLAVDSFRGSVHYDGQALILQDWDVSSYGNHLFVSGNVPLDVGWRKNAPPVRGPDAPMNVSIRADGTHLDFLPLLVPGVKEASGIAHVDGKVSGTLAKPFLQGQANLTEGRFRLAESETELADVALTLKAEGAEIRTENFRFRVGESLYAVREMLFTLDGLKPVMLRSTLDFTNASVEVWLKPPQPFRTRLSGVASLTVDFVGMRTARRESSPSDLSSPLERALRLGSYLDGVVVVESAVADVATYQLVHAEPLVARLRKGTLEFGSLTKGRWDILSQDVSWTEAIYALPLVPLVVRQSVPAEPSQVLAFNLKGTWNLTRTFDVTMNGTMGAHLLNEAIAKRVPRPPEAPFLALSGQFRFEGRLTGTAKSPRFILSLSGENLHVNSVAVQGVSALLSYAENTLNIERGRFRVSNNEVRIGGTIPFAVDLLAGRVGPLARDFEVLVDSDLKNLDFLPAIFPTVIERAEGTGTVHLTLGGRWEAPLYKGSIEVHHLLLDLPAHHLRLSETSGSLILAGDALRLDPSRPIVGRLNDGTFRITEVAIRIEKGLPQLADIRGTLDDVTFYEPGEYRVKTDATLRLFGPLEHLRLSGEILPLEVRYEQDWKRFLRENLSSETEIQRRAQYHLPLLRGMELDVAIQGDQDIVVDTGAGELEARIDGRVVGLISSPVFVGEVSIPSGEFSYLGNRFRIESGQVTNTDAGRFDPEYTIVASTLEPLRNVRLLDEQGRVQVRDARVQVTLRGRLKQAQPPEFAVTVLNRAQGEEYSLTTQQGISLLTFGDATLISQGTDFTLASATGNLFKEGAQSYLGGRFARALGLRTLNVDLSATDIESSRFSLTKELSSQWIITYASTLQLGQEQRLEIEYLVNRNFSIIGERNEQGKYGVDLKFEYDFR